MSAAWWADDDRLLAWLAQRRRVSCFLFSQEPYWLGCLGEVAARAVQDGSGTLVVHDWSRATPFLGLSSLLRSPWIRKAEGWARSLRVNGGADALARALSRLAPDQVQVDIPSVLHAPNPHDVADMLASLSTTPLRSVLYRGVPAGWATFGSLAHMTASSNADTADPAQVELMLRSFATVFDAALARFERERPEAVLVFNGRLLHDWAIREAAWRAGIAVVVPEAGRNMEHVTVHWDTAHGREQYAQRLLSVQETRAGLSEEEALQVAHAWFHGQRPGPHAHRNHFVRHQRVGFVPEPVPGRRRVTFFTSSSDELLAAGPQWLSPLGTQEEVLTELAEQAARDDRLELVIRVHPHTLLKNVADQQWWRSFGASLSASVTVVPPGSTIDSYALAESSALVLSFGSTIGLEAMYWGTPSATLGPSLYDSLDAVPHADAVQTALRVSMSTDEVEERQRRALPWGLHEGTLGSGYRYFQPQTPDYRFAGTPLARWGRGDRLIPKSLMQRRRDRQRAQDTGVEKASRVLGA